MDKRERTVEAWGEVDGQPVQRHTLRNRSGSILRVSSYGATIAELHVPDRNGKRADVVLGFDRLDGYVGEHPYFGGIVGRCANRIAGAAFELDGQRYELAANDGRHHLHGGVRGFDRYVWKATPIEVAGELGVRFERMSPDGEEGYPGVLSARVDYILTDADEVRAEVSAACDRPTICNLASHAYWNLDGHAAGDVRSHRFEIAASRYTPADAELIPIGELESVVGTPLDFRSPRTIEEGLDHNLVIDGTGMRRVARVVAASSGRTLEMWSDQPGCQLYTGNFLDGSVRGKGDHPYEQFGGFCLETQYHPDSIHRPNWPSPLLRPGEAYVHTMEWRFSCAGD